jgi:hypothetical protein
VIVAVLVSTLPGRVASSYGLATRLTAYKRTEREVRVLALVGDDVRPQVLEDVLHPIEGFTVHKRLEASNVLTRPCPFHPDIHPRLRIHVASGAYRCMACGEKGGDVQAFHRSRYPPSPGTRKEARPGAPGAVGQVGQRRLAFAVTGCGTNPCTGSGSRQMRLRPI